LSAAPVPAAKGHCLKQTCGHAVTAHEHLLIDQFFENAHGPWLVLAAFVATDSGHAACIFER